MTPDYWPAAKSHLAKKDKVRRKLMKVYPDARLNTRGNPFQTLARSIVGQQISVKAAQSVWNRFVETNAAAAAPSVAAGAGRGRGPALTTPATVYVEDKFDGIRAQLHASPARTEIFSRDLKRITGQFPEIAEKGSEFSSEVILDGEIIAFAADRKLTFFDLQKRLGRKTQALDLFETASADVPVIFVAFDLLFLDGRSLLRTALPFPARTDSTIESAARWSWA